jgi:predicted ArsR family transcriptional regulator
MANQSLLGPTKTRILDLIRRAPRTIHELAGELGLTDNAVRAHVLGLERDRLVEPEGRRPGARKPSVTYALAPAGEQLYAKPYPQVLNAVLDQVEARGGNAELLATLREVGSALARERLGRVHHLRGRARLEEVARLLDELGGIAEVEPLDDGHYALRGYSCPIAAVIPQHPEGCRLSQAFVEGLLGPTARVEECCQREGSPACRFEIDLKE